MRIRSALLTILLLGLGSALACGQDLGIGDRSKSPTVSTTKDPADSKHFEAKLSTLPGVVQAPISSVLGRDNSSYWVDGSAGSFHATNPQHALAMDFTPAGVTIRSHDQTFGLKLFSCGYGEALLPISEVPAQGRANRVEYKHQPVTEWYVNGPLGLEQGFTFDRPPGPANGEPLTVGLKISGTLLATLTPDRRGLTLAQSNGSAVLSYAGLSAHDADGSELSAWLELRDTEFLLHIRDTDAHYPVVIDPLVQTKLTASDGAAGDWFGWSVALSSDGNTLVVGAVYAQIGNNPHQGAAYVFSKPPAGWATTSTFDAKLTASDGSPSDYFAYSVTTDGDTVVVGALFANIGNNPMQGAAYVFAKPKTGWSTATETAKLTASDGRYGTMFGWPVDLSADTLVVGAHSPYDHHGAAYVFVKPISGWVTGTETAKLTAPNDYEMGWSVAIRGDTLVVGTPLLGLAYVYVKQGAWTTTTTPDATLNPDSAYLWFGSSVAISEDDNTVVVGAPFASSQYDRQGAAYVFLKPADGWATTSAPNAMLTASDGAAGDYLGYTVAIGGDSVLASAHLAKVGSNYQQGAAYMIAKPQGGWATATETAKLIASDGGAGDQFGFPLAIRNNTIVAGAFGAAIGSNPQQGAVYIFAPAVAPSIRANPTNKTVCPGTTTSFGAAADGYPTPTVQWQMSTNGVTFNPIPDATSTTLTFTANPSGNGSQYQAVFTNVAGSVTSNAAALTVETPPTVTTDPVSQTVKTGSFVTFTAAASGSPAPAIQWQLSTNAGASFSDILGANSTSLVFMANSLQNGYQYRAVLTNDCGTATTAPATLTVIGPIAMLTPTSIDFGNVYLHQLTWKVVSLRNTGNSPLTINRMSLKTGINTDWADFPFLSMCPPSVPAGKSCAIYVFYNADDLGVDTATLSIVDNAPGSPQVISLTGTVIKKTH